MDYDLRVSCAENLKILPGIDELRGLCQSLATLDAILCEEWEYRYGDPETYRRWGEEYYGARLSPKAIAQIYRHDRLTEFLVRSLNPKARLKDLHEEIEGIGYPL